MFSSGRRMYSRVLFAKRPRNSSTASSTKQVRLDTCHYKMGYAGVYR